MIGWAAQHPLLDVSTLQAVLRPGANPQAIKPLQQRITHLFQLGLIEVRLWAAGKTPLEQQRYLLTPAAHPQPTWTITRQLASLFPFSSSPHPTKP